MRVLEVDDDLVIAELVRAVVEQDGHECVLSSSARDLPEGPFDVVVTDLMEMGAYTTAGAARWLARLAARYPGTPIIVTTAHSAARRDAASLPARRVILKPFDIDELTRVIDDARAR
jgi:DNA-binding NtrC family response regulator